MWGEGEIWRHCLILVVVLRRIGNWECVLKDDDDDDDDDDDVCSNQLDEGNLI